MSQGDGTSAVGEAWSAGARSSGSVGDGSIGSRIGTSWVESLAKAGSCPDGCAVSPEADEAAWPDRATRSRQRGQSPEGASRDNSAPQAGQVGWTLIGGSPRGRSP